MNPFIYCWKIREVKLAVKETLRLLIQRWSTLLFSYKFIPNQNLLYEKNPPRKEMNGFT